MREEQCFATSGLRKDGERLARGGARNFGAPKQISRRNGGENSITQTDMNQSEKLWK